MEELSHEDEQIMILAKLNGHWDSAIFRLQLADDGRCLEALVDDEYNIIASIARNKLNYSPLKRDNDDAIQ